MILNDNIVWVIMSKDRQLIAKGSPRNRYLIKIDNLEKDKKKFLTYASKAKAESAFKVSGFYHSPYPYDADLSEYLEAVECHLNLKTV